MPFAPGPRARAKRIMKALPLAVEKRLAAANEANADDMVGTVKGFIHDDTGTLSRSVKREAVPEKSPIAQRVSSGGAATTKRVRKSKKGNAPLYDYALANEFGTEDMQAQPSFWPAWRLKRRRYKARMSRAGKKGIEEATSK